MLGLCICCSSCITQLAQLTLQDCHLWAAHDPQPPTLWSTAPDPAPTGARLPGVKRSFARPRAAPPSLRANEVKRCQQPSCASVPACDVVLKLAQLLASTHCACHKCTGLLFAFRPGCRKTPAFSCSSMRRRACQQESTTRRYSIRQIQSVTLLEASGTGLNLNRLQYVQCFNPRAKQCRSHASSCLLRRSALALCLTPDLQARLRASRPITTHKLWVPK